MEFMQKSKNSFFFSCNIHVSTQVYTFQNKKARREILHFLFFYAFTITICILIIAASVQLFSSRPYLELNNNVCYTLNLFVINIISFILPAIFRKMLITKIFMIYTSIYIIIYVYCQSTHKQKKQFDNLYYIVFQEYYIKLQIPIQNKFLSIKIHGFFTFH